MKTIVRKANVMSRTRNNITDVNSARLISALVAQIRPNDKFTIDKEYSINLYEVLPHLKDVNSKYKDHIFKLCESLNSLGIWVKKEKNSEQFVILSYLIKVGYRNSEIFGIFNPLAEDYLFNLKNNFTEYYLFDFLQLKGRYSQQMFELFSSWKNSKCGYFDISMNELHILLDTPKTVRNNFSIFKTRVLDLVEKEFVNLAKPLIFKWEVIQKENHGAVKTLRFTFVDKSKKTVESVKDSKIEGDNTSKIETVKDSQVEASTSDTREILKAKGKEIFDNSLELQKQFTDFIGKFKLKRDVECVRRLWFVLLGKNQKCPSADDVEVDGSYMTHFNPPVGFMQQWEEKIAQDRMGNLLQSMVSGKRIAS